MRKKKAVIKQSPGERIFGAVNITFLGLLAAVMIYPFWHEICVSLSTSTEVARGGMFFLPRGLTTDAYQRVLGTSYIWTAFKNSFLIAALSTAFSVFFTALMAYPLSKSEIPGIKVIKFFVVFTMLFNGGTIPNYLLVKELGWIDQYWAMVIPGMISAYNAIIVINFFSALPRELEESAHIDGANPVQIFYKIVLPLSKPVLATLSLWVAVGSWNNFMGALLYFNKKSLYTLPLLLKDIISGQRQMYLEGITAVSSTDSVIAATIIVSVLPILILYPYLQKYFVKGVMLGSVKG